MKHLFSIILVFCALATTAQETKIQMSSERQKDNTVNITYSKLYPGTYTVVLNFSEYDNTNKPSDTYTVDGPGGTLLTLKPTDVNRSIGYRYNYRYVLGKLKPKVAIDFCYLLPYPPGIETSAGEQGYVNAQYFGASTPADWKSYFFSTLKEETVTAIRKGLVIEITDKYENNTAAVYTSQKNSIIIEHEDGTLVRYRGFKKGSIKVKEGEIIIPNQELGINDVSNNRFGVSIYIYYLSSVDFESLAGQRLNNSKSLYSILTPKFLTAEGACGVLENRKAYTSFSNEAAITKEMSKKEIKRFKGK